MLIIPAIFEGFLTRRDKTYKLIFGTNECTPSQVSEFSKSLQQFVFIAIKVDQFRTEEKDMVDNLESGMEDTGKSQAQRIRSVLLILWKQDPKGFSEFTAYYKHMTELYINHLKGRIEK